MNIIPKTIHYCWFGQNEIPIKLQKYVEGWKKSLPDYEFILWNEDNYNIQKNDYIKEAYANKKWAFVSDYVRLDALNQHGGIYLDTDIELLSSFDSLLINEAFIGFESRYKVGSAVIGSTKQNPWINSLLDQYQNKNFIQNGKLDTTPNTDIITRQMIKKYDLKLNNRLQYLDFVTVYPRDYFYPEHLITHKLNLTDNSICIHHWENSWGKNNTNPIKNNLKKTIYFFLGETITEEAFKIIKKAKQ